MYLFIEKGLRGGISYTSKRYAKASSKYMNDCNSKKTSEFINSFDWNNLYSQELSQYCPYGGFKWLKNINGFDVNSISEKSPIGHFFEVDLEYPDKLYKFHNDYPLSPEKRAVSSNMFSKYCKEIADKLISIK